MQVDLVIVLGLGVILLLLSLLKAENLVKLTFGSYLLLVFNFGLGLLLGQWYDYLLLSPNATFFGISSSGFAEFLLNAQPTLLLLLYALLLWFFVSNSHLSIQFSSELFEKKIQTLLWCVLCCVAIFSTVYYSLAYFGGTVYDFLFKNEMVIRYISFFPLVSFIGSIITILASSHLNFKIFIKRQDTSLS